VDVERVEPAAGCVVADVAGAGGGEIVDDGDGQL